MVDPILALKREVAADPELRDAMREDPVKALQEAADTMPLRTDKWIYRGVVAALGAVAMMTCAGYIVLSFYGKVMPGEAATLGATALGALGALLARPPA